MKLTLEEIAQRAELADRTPVDYRLGAGASSCTAKVPYTRVTLKDGTVIQRACDCTAFTCWCSGVDKHDKDVRNAKGQRLWWGSDNIVADATGPQRRWRRIDKPMRGCTAVWPGHRRKDGSWSYGHAGIVVDVDRQATIDCSSSADDGRPNSGDAITRRLNSYGFWRSPKVIYVVPSHL